MIKLTANEKTILCYMVCNTNSWCECIDFNKDEWLFGEDYFEGHIDLSELMEKTECKYKVNKLKGIIGSLVSKGAIENIGMNGDCNGFFFYKEVWAELRNELKATQNEMTECGVKFN